MKILILIILLMLSALQYRLWLGEKQVDSARVMWAQIDQQQQENNTLRLRNAQLQAEVYDLKHGEAVIEERARTHLGMIRRGEVFYQILPRSQ